MVKILKCDEKELWSKKILILRVMWRSSQIKEETWKRESKIWKKYPNLFLDPSMTPKF